ncbi:TlpA family protein disulfide reductase [Sorangium sp. So ce1153]|uniref:TlpA family protein disulfide reductase n=1 Tax=Sorangium sp. So ce1153 TaxID=3133333 RepID=UPI003F62230E
MNARLRAFGGAAGVLMLLQALAVGLYWAVEHRRQAERPGLPFAHEQLSGAEPAPDEVLARQDGSELRLSALRGQVVLLHVWATWCGPCRAELPALLDLGRELQRDGKLKLVAVSVDESWDVVRAFFDGEVPPEVVRAGSPALARRLGVSALPDTFLVRPDGSMALRFTGARDWSAPEARLLLTARAWSGPGEPGAPPPR